MKIQIVGNNKLLEKRIHDVINSLPNIDVEIVNDEVKLNIKRHPAIIIENVLIDDINELSTSELKNVILQFFET